MRYVVALRRIHTQYKDGSALRGFVWLGALLLASSPALPAPALLAQTPASSPDAVALVRRAVQHRADAEAHHAPLRYLLRKVEERRDGRRDTTKEIIETRDGDVARLVAIDGKPLSPEAARAELDRLDTLAHHPELQEHRHRSEQKDAERIDHLLSLLPEAFLYQTEGVVPCGAAQCYRLRVSPNPRFHSPDLESTVLRRIAGEVWIDQNQERLVRLDAHFIGDVDFGFGVLGRLNQGGSVVLEQSDIGDHDWELTGLHLNLTGKALMVKPVEMHVTETASHFSRVPANLGYRDAIELLRHTPAAQ